MIKYLVPPAETSGIGVTYYAEEKNENIFVLFHFNSLEFFNHVSALHSILVCTVQSSIDSLNDCLIKKGLIKHNLS